MLMMILIIVLINSFVLWLIDERPTYYLQPKSLQGFLPSNKRVASRG